MWADTLLVAEREFLLRFAIWGAISATVGLTLFLAFRSREPSSPLVTHFALHTGLWGALALGLALAGWSRADLRDYERARQLYRLLGAAIGFELGLILIGVTLALAGWVLGRRLTVVGAGVAILVQGLAWLVLHVGFAGFVRATL